ncbi:MAG: hypothetical protein JEY94_11225 [Melioribacteraceae bacterium]|nr:hypothetical protein [Melioribacteraceae bacterium]
MKRILILLFVIASYSAAQNIGYVETNHPVYDFLDRLNNLNIISDYNSFDLPKTRVEISNYIKIIQINKNKLNNIDLEKLKIYNKEFEVNLTGDSENQQSFYDDIKLNNLFNQKEKYLYYSNKDNKILSLNFISEFDNISKYDVNTEESYNTSIIKFGAKVSGSINGVIGFNIEATNGTYSGNKELTFERKELSYNYKYTQDRETITATDFFDQTTGYLTADFDYLKLKIGRDKKTIGYGHIKTILSEEAPLFDFVQADINYSIFSFSYFHGKLLGDQSFRDYGESGSLNYVDEKFFGYHRLGLNFSRHLQFGIGEMVVYGQRSIDLSYINPFAFYKSMEHQNQDRDNAMLFLDVQNQTIKGLKIFGNLVIDDIDFGKFGSGWYGNKLLYNFGFTSSNLYNIFPADITFQYIRSEPYMYTHRLSNNSLTSQGVSLVTPLMPNSSLFSVKICYYPHERFNISSQFNYTLHGANEYDSEGRLVNNFGGNINDGHRKYDSDKADFLDGKKEYYREGFLHLMYEPVNSYFLNLYLIYRNNSSGIESKNEFVTRFNLTLKI